MRRHRQSGFTVMESVMAISVMSVLLLSFSIGSLQIVDKASATHAEESDLGVCHTALCDIENAIRLAESVSKAGTNVLVLRTRYFVDTDTEIERVSYTLSGGLLKKAVAEGEAGPWSTGVTIASNVSTFKAFTLEIEDDFDSSRYDDPYTTGDDLGIDTATKVEYDLIDLGEVDPDVSASYDADTEKLQVDADLLGRTLAVSPNVPKTGVLASVEFTPKSAGKEFIPLYYGESNPALNSLGVSFSPDGNIELKSIEGGKVIASTTAAMTWSTLSTYTVSLEIQDGAAYAWIEKGGVVTEVGSIASGSLDNQRVHLGVTDPGSTANFDNVVVDYPFVDIHLEVTTEDNTTVMVGGAMLRNRK